MDEPTDSQSNKKRDRKIIPPFMGSESETEKKKKSKGIPLKLIVILVVVGGLVVIGCVVGYLLLVRKDQSSTPTSGSSSEESTQEEQTPVKREKGEIKVSFVPPTTVVWSAKLPSEQWQWSAAFPVTIENKTGVDLKVPTYGDFYQQNSQATFEAIDAASELSTEMNTKVLNGEDGYNLHLSFQYSTAGMEYRLPARSDQASWSISAGETSTENFYFEANSVSSACPNSDWDTICTLVDVKVRLIIGGDIRQKVELTNLPEGMGNIKSDGQDVPTLMKSRYSD